VKRANDLISEDMVSSQGTVSDGILQKREKSRGGGSGGFTAANSSLSVCVYLSSGFKGQCFNYAIPIAKSYLPMTSLPYLGLIVLPLWTPGGVLARRVSN